MGYTAVSEKVAPKKRTRQSRKVVWVLINIVDEIGGLHKRSCDFISIKMKVLIFYLQKTIRGS